VEKYSVDRIKIYDYFLLFPTELRKVTLPPVWNNFKKIKTENKYNQVQNSIDVFMRISGFQDIALNALSSFGLIDNQLFSEDFIKKTNKPIKLELKLTPVEQNYFDLVNRYFNNLNLKELKQRTKLIDYRYELPSTK